MTEDFVDDVRDNVDNILIQDAIDKILKDCLSAIEYLVIKGRFYECKTQKQCSTEIKFSVRRTGKIESKALRKLRHPKWRSEWRKIWPDVIDEIVAFEEARRKERKKRHEEARIKWERECAERRKRQRPLQFLFLSSPIVPLCEEPIKPVEKPKASFLCPGNMTVKFDSCRKPYLCASPPQGYSASVSRDRDPETYDRWLSQRLEELNDVKVL